MNKKLTQTYAFQIDKDLSEELKYVSKKQNVSLYVTLLAAFKVMLFRLSGQYDLFVATPNATFSDILALNTSLNVDEPFDSLLQRIKEIARHANLNPKAPFLETDESHKSNTQNLLHEFMFVFQNFAEEELNRDKFEENASRFGLTLSVTQTSDYLQGLIVYATDLFNESQIIRMGGHYKELLHSIVKQEHQKVGELPMLTKAEHELLTGFNNTAVKHSPEKTVIDLFEEQVERRPDRTAVVFKDDKVTYRQLNERANQLAHHLREKGVGEETLVPICIERSVEMIVAILGTWKAGGAYVPIDPESPDTRIKYFLKDTKASLVVSNAEGRQLLLSALPGVDVISINGDSPILEQCPITNLISRPAPQHLAYVIYTSGSTGKPKGVMVEHKSIFNYILSSKEKFINENETSAGTFVHLSYTFDASLKSILTPLVSGKSLVISSQPSAYVFEDPNLYKYAPYDFIQLTPSHLEFFYSVYKDDNDEPITGKVSIGGEALYLSHFDSLIETGEKLEVVNEYGPTETTVACSSYTFNIFGDKRSRQRLPIGTPIDNVQIFILNEYEQPVPLGVIGEIYVGGVQVARGYLNNSDLTKKKFIANPFDNNKANTIYKTGDMGRWLSDGNIECIGRKDDQVKIRGYRVEPGEVESILIKNDMISQATVIAKDDRDNVKHLVAYIVPNGIFDKTAVISYLKAWLPDYMVPEIWIMQDHLPLTPNGKIDKNNLPEPDFKATSMDEGLSENTDAPRTEEEKRIAEIWQDVLGVKHIGVNDNFFELGEPSLLAIKVLRLVEEVTGQFLPLSTIYEYPTIDKFVKRLKENK